MNTPRNDQERLEQLIGTALRELPSRQAPASLETRVMRELARRAARPWWQQGFSRWPLAARALFAPLSAGLVWLAYLAMASVSSGVDVARHSSFVTEAHSRWDTLSSLAHSLQALATLATSHVPGTWIYGGLCFAALLYAALFGLGAAAFRSLIATPNAARY